MPVVRARVPQQSAERGCFRLGGRLWATRPALAESVCKRCGVLDKLRPERSQTAGQLRRSIVLFALARTYEQALHCGWLLLTALCRYLFPRVQPYIAEELSGAARHAAQTDVRARRPPLPARWLSRRRCAEVGPIGMMRRDGSRESCLPEEPVLCDQGQSPRQAGGHEGWPTAITHKHRSCRSLMASVAARVASPHLVVVSPPTALMPHTESRLVLPHAGCDVSPRFPDGLGSEAGARPVGPAGSREPRAVYLGKV